MVNYFVGLLIYISQGFLVILTGEPDIMFCAMAWQKRNESKFWSTSRYIVDNYVWPLSVWHYEGMTHCESCFWAEQKRLTERIEEYAKYIAEGKHKD
jgi:hypothetical protein